MKKGPSKPLPIQRELHPRNLHRAPYDFPRLVEDSPNLSAFVRAHPLGGSTIDFANPLAVTALNRALLKTHYRVDKWDLPPGYLCPPIPSRADLLHHAADLLREDLALRNSSRSVGSSGRDLFPSTPYRVLDLGVGANCVYPLIGVHVYGWNFVGTEIDPKAVEWARKIVAENPRLRGRIEVRLQISASAIFEGVVQPSEQFGLSICNPPFHASAREAAAGTERKLRNLAGDRRVEKTVLNFGGRENELWCPGGEVAFVQKIIRESAARPTLCVWFTSLISKQGSLPILYRALTKAHALETRTIEMFAGQKQSRLLAWTFLSPRERRSELTSAHRQKF